MTAKKPTEISTTKLLALGFKQEAKEGAVCVFVRRNRDGKVLSSVMVSEDRYIVAAENVPKDAKGEYIFFRRINRVRHGKVIEF